MWLSRKPLLGAGREVMPHLEPVPSAVACPCHGVFSLLCFAVATCEGRNSSALVCSLQ